MNAITNFPIYANVFPAGQTAGVNFCGVTPVEQLGKDIFVGVRDKLIQETAFFRQPEELEFIKEYIKTALKGKKEINIIDGACSKGYETYSLAMLLENIDHKINITGFDIGKEAICEAKKGIFFIKQISGSKNIVSMYKMGIDAFNDDYLAFSKKCLLEGKQAEYKQMFDKFYTELPGYKNKQSIKERLKGILFKELFPSITTRAFQIKPEKAELCKFVQGDILKLDEIVSQASADVLLFRNALYHLTTKEYTLGLKLPLPDEIVIPVVKDVVKQIDKAVASKGLFVLGSHASDHLTTAGKTLYNELEMHNFTPVLYNSAGTKAVIWKKNEF